MKYLGPSPPCGVCQFISALRHLFAGPMWARGVGGEGEGERDVKQTYPDTAL